MLLYKKRTRSLTVKIEEELLNQIKTYCKSKKITLTSVVEYGFKTYLTEALLEEFKAISQPLNKKLD